MTRLSQPDFLLHIETVHSYYGDLIGTRAGEAFHIKEVLEIQDLVRHFAQSAVGSPQSAVGSKKAR